MGRKSSPQKKKELIELIAKYESAKSDNKNTYLDSDQLANLADYYATNKMFNEAQEVISYGFKLHPGNTALLIEQAYLYLDTQRLQEAKETAKNITEEYEIEVKLLKAELLLNEGNIEEAQTLLDKVEDPDDVSTIIDIAYLYLDMGYYQEANSWLIKGTGKYEDEEDYIVLLADYAFLIEDYKTASKLFNKLIDINSFNPEYWAGLAKCYYAIDLVDKSIEACDFALAIDDKCGEAYMYRGHCYFQLYNLDAAASDYKLAVSYKAMPPELGYMFLGLIYTDKQEWKTASVYYQKVIALFKEKGDEFSPTLVDIYTNLACALSVEGSYTEAHELCEKAKIIKPDEPTIYLAEGRIYMDERKKKKAKESWASAMRYASTANSWYQIGNFYMEYNLNNDAKFCYRQAYALNPKLSNLPEQLALISLLTDDMENFRKYNSEAKNPLNEKEISSMLAIPSDFELQDPKEELSPPIPSPREEKRKKKKGDES